MRVARIPAFNFNGQMMTPTLGGQIDHPLLLDNAHLKVQ